MYYLTITFLLILGFVKDLVFSKTALGRKYALVSYPSMIGMVLSVYLVEPLYIIIIMETLIVVIWVYYALEIRNSASKQKELEPSSRKLD